MRQAKETSAPVFAVVWRSGIVQAAHPDHEGPMREETEAALSGDDGRIRVGTAHPEADGSYLISLSALPGRRPTRVSTVRRGQI